MNTVSPMLLMEYGAIKYLLKAIGDTPLSVQVSAVLTPVEAHIQTVKCGDKEAKEAILAWADSIKGRITDVQH